MQIGNFYGLTAPNLIILKDTFSEDDFVSAVTLLNNPVDKNFIKHTRQELGFFRKALNNMPVNYVASITLPASLSNPSVEICNGVIEGLNNKELEIECLKRYLAAQIACYVCQPNRKNTIMTSLFSDVNSAECVRGVFQQVITEYLKTNSFKMADLDTITRKIARKLLDRKNDTIMTTEKEKLIKTIVKSFMLKEELVTEFMFGKEKMILTENEIKIISWFKQKQDVLEACLPHLVENTIASTQKVFSMPFRELIFRRPERLISEVVHCYKSANVSVGKENVIVNIKNNILKELEVFNTLFEENVVLKDTYKEDVDFIVTLNEEEPKTLTSLKRAIKNYDLRIENCDYDKLEVFAKIFDFTCKLTKDYYNYIFDVDMSLEEWNRTITKLNALGIAGLNFQTATLFIRSLSLYSFDDHIIIEKSAEEIEVYKLLIREINAFLDSQLPFGERIR